MWSGGEASKARLHADYKLALRRDQAPLLREAGGWEVSPDGLGWVWCLSWAYLPKGWPAALTTRRARRSRAQGAVLR